MIYYRIRVRGRCSCCQNVTHMKYLAASEKNKPTLLFGLIKTIILSVLCVSMNSCCLPFTFRAASYIHPSRRGVRSIIAKANYTPEQAYVHLCNELMKNPKNLRFRTIPIPRFAIIDGKYFFYTRNTEEKVWSSYEGWEFDQNTGAYKYIYQPYKRLFFMCTSGKNQFVITENPREIYNYIEAYRLNIRESQAVEDALSKLTDCIDK